MFEVNDYCRKSHRYYNLHQEEKKRKERKKIVAGIVAHVSVKYYMKLLIRHAWYNQRYFYWAQVTYLVLQHKAGMIKNFVERKVFYAFLRFFC